MTFQSNITQIKRPRILIKAAQISAKAYNRDRVLKRLLRVTTLPTHGNAIQKLQEYESIQNDARQSGDASYKIQTHIAILGALLGEMYLAGT